MRPPSAPAPCLAISISIEIRRPQRLHNRPTILKASFHPQTLLFSGRNLPSCLTVLIRPRASPSRASTPTILLRRPLPAIILRRTTPPHTPIRMLSPRGKILIMDTLLTITTATYPPRLPSLKAMDKSQLERTHPILLTQCGRHLCRLNISSPFRPVLRLSRVHTLRQHRRTIRRITALRVTILDMVPTVRLRTPLERLRVRLKHRILLLHISLSVQIMHHQAINTSTTVPSVPTRRRLRALLPTCIRKHHRESSDIRPMLRFQPDPWRMCQRSQRSGASMGGLCHVARITSVSCRILRLNWKELIISRSTGHLRSTASCRRSKSGDCVVTAPRQHIHMVAPESLGAEPRANRVTNTTTTKKKTMIPKAQLECWPCSKLN